MEFSLTWNREITTLIGDYLWLILPQQLETMPKLRSPSPLFWEHSKIHTLLLGDFHLYLPHPPSRCLYRWIKDGKEEDWQESWLLWQRVNEMPKLMKLIVRAGIRYTSQSYLSCGLLSFLRDSVPCLHLTVWPLQGVGGQHWNDRETRGDKNQQKILVSRDKSY